MKSFKLDNTQSGKEQIFGGGVFLIVVGLALTILWSVVIGFFVILVGVAMMLAGKYAS